MNNLLNYLNRYYKYQKDILLVYRPNEQSNWSTRCKFLSPEYSPRQHYNHRSILFNEVVMEFDNQDQKLNKDCADMICRRLKKYNITFSKWHSGNKSYHVHCLLNIKQCNNVSLLKTTFMRYFGKLYKNTDTEKYYFDKMDIPKTLEKDKILKIFPDMKLSSENHLIRAEKGIHEKTGMYKTLIQQSKNYPSVSEVPEIIWERYGIAKNIILKRKLTMDLKELDKHPAFQLVLNSTRFRNYDDGRERALFMLIHVLKGKYEGKKEELESFLIDWYKYSGGYKLTEGDIKNKIRYHWNKTYCITENYLYNLLKDLGINIEDVKNGKLLLD